MPLKARRIIGEAWEFTQNNRKLIIWYAFIPSVLTTLAGILYLVYQYYAFASSPLFGNLDQGFLQTLILQVLQIVRENFAGTMPILVTAGIIAVLYILIPPFCEGAIIQLVARKRNGQEVRTRDGLRHGFMSFLPLFEYSWLIRTFSLVSLTAWAALIMRSLGWEAFQTFLPVFIIFAIVGVILTVLFTYSEFFIVIDDRRVIESVAKSSVLVMTHLEETILLSILMLIISIRIIIQILFVFLIPAVMLVIAYFIASATLPAIALTIALVVGTILLYFASYLSGTIHVFAASVWTFTFLELTAEEITSAREKGPGSD